MAKTRFPFATVLVSSMVNGTLSVVRRHTSPVNAKRYAEGRIEESADAGTDKEYAILVRTAEKNGAFDPTTDYVTGSVGAEKTATGGKRFPAATVTLTKDGNIDEIVKLHTSPNNAFKFATGANAEAGGRVEYAVMLRTSLSNGSFPTIKASK